MRAFRGVACGLGLLLAIAPGARAEQTNYDSLGRVISVITDDGKQTTYVYDAAGNRTTVATAATTSTKPPIAVNDTVSYTYNGSAMSPFDPRVNDSDPNNLPLTIVGVAPAQLSSVSFTPTQITYTPPAFVVGGSDTFAYTIQNSAGVTASALVTVNLTILPPVANPDSVSLPENGTVTFDPRVNDTDPANLTILISGVGSAGHGVIFNNNGTSVTYIPITGYYGNDSFSYTIKNGRGLSASSTVGVNVAVSPPIANPDNVATNQNQALNFDPHINDSDPNNLPLTISGVGTPSHGGAVVNGGTSVTYTPASGYSGLDGFSYSIVNSAGGTASSTVSVTVSPAATLSASVNVSTWSWYSPKNGPISMDGAATTAVSGGTTPYTYAWQYVSGNTTISATTPTASSTQWTWTPVRGATRTAVWRCQVTDSASHVAYTGNVTVTVQWDNSN